MRHIVYYCVILYIMYIYNNISQYIITMYIYNTLMPLSNTTANKGHNSDPGENQTHASPIIPAQLLTATDLARIRETRGFCFVCCLTELIKLPEHIFYLVSIKSLG